MADTPEEDGISTALPAQNVRGETNILARSVDDLIGVKGDTQIMADKKTKQGSNSTEATNKDKVLPRWTGIFKLARLLK